MQPVRLALVGEIDAKDVSHSARLLLIVPRPNLLSTSRVQSTRLPAVSRKDRVLDHSPPVGKRSNEIMKLLRLEEVIAMTGLSRSSIYRYEINSAFPKRRQTGRNTVRWLEADIVAWIESGPVPSALHERTFRHELVQRRDSLWHTIADSVEDPAARLRQLQLIQGNEPP
jgi:prophage regulatory protein